MPVIVSTAAAVLMTAALAGAVDARSDPRCFIDGRWVARAEVTAGGAPIRERLTAGDCGDAEFKQHAYLLRVSTAASFRFSAQGGVWIEVEDRPTGRSIAAARPPLDRSAGAVVETRLEPGVYIVRVGNAAARDFTAYTLEVAPGGGGGEAARRGAPAQGGSAPPAPRRDPLEGAVQREAPAEIAAVEAIKSRLTSPDWRSRRDVVMTWDGATTANPLSTTCGGLTSPTPTPSVLTYRSKGGQESAHGVVRFSGDTSVCRPVNEGVILYADGSRWIGQVSAGVTASGFFKGQGSHLPRPDGLGEFTNADGVRVFVRAAPLDPEPWAWIAREILVPPRPAPPPPQAAEPTKPKPKPKPAPRRPAPQRPRG